MGSAKGEVVMNWLVEACDYHTQLNGAKEWIFEKVQDGLRQKGKCKNCSINVYERAIA